MSSTTNPSTQHTSTIGAIGAPSRRNTELALLVFAVVIPVFAYANVGLALDDQVPAGLLSYGLGLGLMAGLGHLAVRKFAPYADPLLLPLATLLNGLGLVAIWRLDQSERLQQSRTFVEAAPRQLMYSAIGVALFVAVLFFLKDHRVLQRYTYISMAGALVLLLLPLVPGLGHNVFGARIWIKIPGLGTLQPGEFAKIVLAVFFAGYLMVKRDALALASRRFMGLYLPRGRDLGPIIVVWIISILILVFETDLGTSLLFFGMFVIMLYVATERTSWIVFGLLMSAAARRRRGELRAAHPDACAGLAEPGARVRPQPRRRPGRHRPLRAGHAGAVGLRLRRHPRLGLGPGPLRPHRIRGQLRLHPRHLRRGARPGRRHGAAAAADALIVERGVRTPSPPATRSASCSPSASPAPSRSRSSWWPAASWASSR